MELATMFGTYSDMPDLVDSSDGFTFDETNEQSLVDVFNCIATLSKEQLMQMSRAAVERISRFTPEIWAQQVVNLLKI